ncbi:MAG: 23S rRNA (uracil(1939)-C(5))-methyltransferase RlmD [Candidatus Accumulibacter appositus]|uniref:23S rRNA (uracil(1939)-C(5))-methyltransferase RlmD n=1 Tax=Candidatus Accumulibacter appositus TaxID=1454003 RepID=A0A011PL61_9PROT|nr:23S rRNA (uracil(1939)-C(5))-methyltransferase RlmD [Accumulibacter sp.]EXI77782.1 MAG: 23S rRNA (uracil(1939)-C(5))-methyltransferase RlmD [Candidatus Accumulibacter appositus]HRF05658.1 23S rRNA (uracil(1939)-C(5))-methyltransferase RlmD [Accumulibacter sp.]
MPTGIIDSLDHEGRGLVVVDGKTIFIEGALPGERVEYAVYRRKPTYEHARTLRVLDASADRVTPRCPHFGVCGGCSMQHLDAGAQVAAKQRLLEDNLRHLGEVRAEQLYAPIHGPTWAYRYRARLSVRFVAKKGGVLVGFRERQGRYVADMQQCEVLPAHLSAMLLPLRELIGGLSICNCLPQIEVAVGERVTALVLRVLEAPSQPDEALLRDFADRYGVVFYLQPKGPASAYRFHPQDGPPLSYLLPDFGVEHFFSPTEFTQVNHAVNRVLVRRAMSLLEPRPGERIGDMFCGLGNFTLAIARSGAQVIGIEGSPELVARAAENAAANGLEGWAEYRVANLFEATAESLAAFGHLDKMLIDPPRDGALELVKSLAADGPRRIVYISCSPPSLARDASILVKEKGYRLRGAGVVNMFPNTSHVESIALFERLPAS